MSVQATRVSILGCPVDAINMGGAVQRAVTAMRTRSRLRHCAINTAKLVKMQSDPELQDDVTSSGLITADGMGIVLAARLIGRPLPERVTGIDLMMAILAQCAEDGRRPYFLGARQQVLDTVISRLSRRHPELVVAGGRNGYFTAEHEQQIVDDINQSGADCLFVGMPTPVKERFLARHGPDLEVPFIMGVGGSLDVLAGHVRRAPGWMQNTGLEWMYRVGQEPRRMWRRYLVTNTIFAGMLLRAAAGRLLGRTRPGTVR